MVSIAVSDPGGGNLYAALSIDGVVVAECYMGSAYKTTLTAIIPNGSSYKLTRIDANDLIAIWSELR